MNPYTITGLAFFWVYAWYGAVSVRDARLAALMAAVFAVIFTSLIEMGRGSKTSVILSSSRLRWMLVALAIAVTLGSLGWTELQAGLVTDAFYHAGMSMAHGQRMLMSDVVAPGSFLYKKLLSHPYGDILHGVNLAVMVLLSYVFFQLTTVPHKYLRWLGLICLFLGVRFLVRSYVLEGDIHPPLRLLPLMLGSLVGGVHAAAFRLPGILALGAFGSLMIHGFKDRIGLLGATLAAGSLVTLPLVWHGGVIVEASIWSALAFGVVTLSLLSSDLGDRAVPYPWLFAMMAMAAVMRQSAFVGLLPLGLMYVWDLCHLPLSWSQCCKKAAKDGFPLLLMVPWTLFIAHTGTPATDASGMPWTVKMRDALSADGGFHYLWSHWRWPGFVLFCVGLIPGRSRAYFFSLATFGLAFGLFYSVKPSLWGLARYQLEIGFAVVALGLMRIFLWTESMFPRRWADAKRVVYVVLGIFLFFGNYQQFKSLRKVQGRLDGVNLFARSRDGSVRSLAEYSFPISEALLLAKSRELHKGLFFDGISYGVMPHILAGYTWEEVRSAGGMPMAWEGADPDKVHKFPQIRAILLVDWSAEQNRRSAEILQSRGWTEEAQIADKDAPDNVIRLLRRP